MELIFRVVALMQKNDWPGYGIANFLLPLSVGYPELYVPAHFSEAVMLQNSAIRAYLSHGCTNQQPKRQQYRLLGFHALQAVHGYADEIGLGLPGR